MTPKEKASMLVLRYMSKLAKMELAKHCATICVDEVLKSNPTFIDCNSSELNYGYWVAVKKEIEKI